MFTCNWVTCQSPSLVLICFKESIALETQPVHCFVWRLHEWTWLNMLLSKGFYHSSIERNISQTGGNWVLLHEEKGGFAFSIHFRLVIVALKSGSKQRIILRAPGCLIVHFFLWRMYWDDGKFWKGCLQTSCEGDTAGMQEWRNHFTLVWFSCMLRSPVAETSERPAATAEIPKQVRQQLILQQSQAVFTMPLSEGIRCSRGTGWRARDQVLFWYVSRRV